MVLDCATYVSPGRGIESHCVMFYSSTECASLVISFPSVIDYQSFIATHSLIHWLPMDKMPFDGQTPNRHQKVSYHLFFECHNRQKSTLSDANWGLIYYLDNATPSLGHVLSLYPCQCVGEVTIKMRVSMTMVAIVRVTSFSCSTSMSTRVQSLYFHLCQYRQRKKRKQVFAVQYIVSWVIRPCQKWVWSFRIVLGVEHLPLLVADCVDLLFTVVCYWM